MTIIPTLWISNANVLWLFSSHAEAFFTCRGLSYSHRKAKLQDINICGNLFAHILSFQNYTEKIEILWFRIVASSIDVEERQNIKTRIFLLQYHDLRYLYATTWAVQLFCSIRGRRVTSSDFCSFIREIFCINFARTNFGTKNLCNK